MVTIQEAYKIAKKFQNRVWKDCTQIQLWGVAEYFSKFSDVDRMQVFSNRISQGQGYSFRSVGVNIYADFIENDGDVVKYRYGDTPDNEDGILLYNKQTAELSISRTATGVLRSHTVHSLMHKMKDDFALEISRYRDIIKIKIGRGGKIMPVLSRFYGIVIKMYFLQSEHNPPHIHAMYNDDVAAIDYMTGQVLEGYLPPKALNLVREWIELNRDDIQKIWETQEFKKLPPLE